MYYNKRVIYSQKKAIATIEVEFFENIDATTDF